MARIGKKNTEKVETTDVLAYRFRIFPNDKQKVIFAKTFGCARYIYNRMLSDHNTLYKEIGKVPNNTPADYKNLDECLWLKEVDSLALTNAQLNLSNAFQKFFDKEANYPVFKKKGRNDSYTTNVSNINNPNLVFMPDPVFKKTGWLKLPKINDYVKVRMHRKVKEGGILKKACIKREPDGKYYCSLTYEYPKQDIRKVEPKTAKGLDMKMGSLYMDNDNNTANMPQYYRKSEAKLAKLQAALSHMEKGSNNYNNQKEKIARLHAKIKHQRKDYLNKESNNLVKAYDIICIENLNMKAMSQALSLGKSVADNGWGMFTKMLAYKAERHGKYLIKVDRFFPSSKTCLICGHVYKELTIVDKTYKCPVCGNTINRDYQAAINILREGVRIFNEEYHIQYVL